MHIHDLIKPCTLQEVPVAAHFIYLGDAYQMIKVDQESTPGDERYVCARITTWQSEKLYGHLEVYRLDLAIHSGAHRFYAIGYAAGWLSAQK